MRRLCSVMVIQAALALGQTLPSFEVVSIGQAAPEAARASAPKASVPVWQPEAVLAGATMDPGLFSMDRANAGSLALYAFGLTPEDILGAPDWFYSFTFSVRAKTPHPARPSEQRLMLQKLLADELGLRFHKASRPGTVYALAATGKVNLKPSAENADSGIRISLDRVTNPPVIVNEATRLSMEDLVTWLSDRLEAPVTNQTGLSGQFDFQLRLQPEVSVMLDSNAAGTVDTQMAGNYVRALRKDLGLDLQSHKGTVTTFVIDAIQKPQSQK